MTRKFQLRELFNWIEQRMRPAEQYCTSLVDYKQRQPFFFEERYDIGTKIGTS